MSRFHRSRQCNAPIGHGALRCVVNCCLWRCARLNVPANVWFTGEKGIAIYNKHMHAYAVLSACTVVVCKTHQHWW